MSTLDRKQPNENAPEWVARSAETSHRLREEFCRDNDCTQLKDLKKKYGEGWYNAQVVPKDKLLRYKCSVFVPNCYIPEIEKYANVPAQERRTESLKSTYSRDDVRSKLREAVARTRKSVLEEYPDYTPMTDLCELYGWGWTYKFPTDDFIHCKNFTLVPNSLVEEIKRNSEVDPSERQRAALQSRWDDPEERDRLIQLSKQYREDLLVKYPDYTLISSVCSMYGNGWITAGIGKEQRVNVDRFVLIPNSVIPEIQKYYEEHLMAGTSHAEIELADWIEEELTNFMNKRGAQPGNKNALGLKHTEETKETMSKASSSWWESHQDEKEARSESLRENNPAKNPENITKAKRTLERKISEFEADNDCMHLKKVTSTYGTSWYQAGIWNDKLLHMGQYTFVPCEVLPEIEKYVSDGYRKYVNGLREEKISQFEKEHDCTNVQKLKNIGQSWYYSWRETGLHQDELLTDGKYWFVPNYLIPEIERYIKESMAGTSHAEIELADAIASEGVEVIRNDRSVIAPLELDIYIPSKNLAIEYNGAFWHGIHQWTEEDEHERLEYIHKLKADLCREKGIRLIQVFSYQWNNPTKRSVLESIIKSALGIQEHRIFARKCEVKHVPFKEYKEFLDENHLHGMGPSAPYRLGLYHNGELVQCIGLGADRFSKSETKEKIPELYRMCTKKGCQVVGGFSKLVKHSGYTKFFSFVDRAVFDSHGYDKLGFKRLYDTDPNYWYVSLDEQTVLNRQSAMKYKLPELLGNEFRPDETETQNMLRCDWIQIFDAGNAKLLYTLRAD